VLYQVKMRIVLSRCDVLPDLDNGKFTVCLRDLD